MPWGRPSSGVPTALTRLALADAIAVYDPGSHLLNGAFSAFADYSGTVAGTVRATDVGHELVTGCQIIISGTTSYNGTFTVTVVDADTFYFTATWVADDATGTWIAQVQDLGDGNGIRCPLMGGMTLVSDPFNGVYAVFALKDAAGIAIPAESLYALVAQLIDRIVTDDSSDTAVVFGLCNEAVDSATIDAIAQGLRLTSNAHYGRQDVTANGANTATNSGSSLTATQIVSTYCRVGAGASALIVAHEARGALDASEAPVAIALGGTSPFVTFGAAKPYGFIAWYRISTMATASLQAFDAYYLRPTVVTLAP